MKDATLLSRIALILSKIFNIIIILEYYLNTT